MIVLSKMDKKGINHSQACIRRQTELAHLTSIMLPHLLKQLTKCALLQNTTIDDSY